MSITPHTYSAHLAKITFPNQFSSLVIQCSLQDAVITSSSYEAWCEVLPQSLLAEYGHLASLIGFDFPICRQFTSE